MAGLGEDRYGGQAGKQGRRAGADEAPDYFGLADYQAGCWAGSGGLSVSSIEEN
jgi:hypothetical protein